MYFHFKYILWHSKQTRRKKVNIKLKYSLVKLLLFGKLFGAQNTSSIQVPKKSESFLNLMTFTCQQYNILKIINFGQDSNSARNKENLLYAT